MRTPNHEEVHDGAALLLGPGHGMIGGLCIKRPKQECRLLGVLVVGEIRGAWKDRFIYILSFYTVAEALRSH